jgi:hypothetical protein
MQNQNKSSMLFRQSKSNLTILKIFNDKKTGISYIPAGKLDFQKFHVYLKDKYHIQKHFCLSEKRKGMKSFMSY